MNTRIAPSPTGHMHVGTARTAYFNWLAARSTGGSFLLRIDDTDVSRSKPEYVDTIVSSLKWLGLDWDNLVYQSSRFDRYKDVVSKLPTKNTDGAITLDIDLSIIPSSWNDNVLGQINISKDDCGIIKDMVLIKSDGSPTYNFCTVVDDIDYNIDYIIRGVDHIKNTSRQIVLFNLLGAKIPQFAHVGLICQNKTPLSKRDGASNLLSYKDSGIDPDAMLNFLARMGWGPYVDDKSTSLLPKDKMLQMFLSSGKMLSSYANLDAQKLASFDRKYKARKRT